MWRRPWFLLLCLAGCAPRSAARPPAAASVAQPLASSAPAVERSKSRPRVVNVVGEKNAFWSPWALPQIVLPAPPPGVPGLPSLPLPWLESAPTTPPTPPPPAPNPPTVTPPTKAPYVILYGATWCGACKQAEAHMKSRAIAYAYKDVDDDANAQELAAKVKAAGEKQGAIPVTDVEGDLLVGWSQKRFDEVYDAKAK